MSASRLDTWIWVLIYGGLILIGLGLAVQREGAALGWSFVVVGGIAAAIGVLLVWVRSRLREDDQ